MALCTVGAVIGTTCMLASGCTGKTVHFTRFSDTLNEFYGKMSLADNCTLDLSMNIEVEAHDYFDMDKISIVQTGTNTLKKHGDELLDFKQDLELTATENLTDNIHSLVGLEVGDIDTEIYVRGNTKYTLNDGLLTEVSAGELTKGDFCRSVVNKYASHAATGLGVIFNDELYNYFMYPEETCKVNLFTNTADCVVKNATYEAHSSSDVLEATITAEMCHASEANFSDTDFMTEEQKDEYYGHLKNRDFTMKLSMSLKMDASAFLTKGKFEELDVPAIADDCLYLDPTNYAAMAATIASENEFTANIAGGGEEYFYDLQRKNGEYTSVRRDTCNASFYGYGKYQSSNEDFTCSGYFDSDDYKINNNLLTIYGSAFSTIKKDMLPTVNSYYGQSVKNYYVSNIKIRYYRITLSYKTLTAHPKINEYGYYDSDQYRTCTSSIYFYINSAGNSLKDYSAK